MPRPIGRDNYVGVEIECFSTFNRNEIKTKLEKTLLLRGKFDVVGDSSIKPDKPKPKEGDIKLDTKHAEAWIKYIYNSYQYYSGGLHERAGVSGLFYKVMTDKSYNESVYTNGRWKSNKVKHLPSEQYLNNPNNRHNQRDYNYYLAKKSYFSPNSFYKGVEVRLLCKQKELNKVVRVMYSELGKLGVKVNKSCGLHVHLDMRHRDRRVCYYNLFKCQDLLVNTNKGRTRTSWCKKNKKANLSIGMYSHHQNGGRYQVINPHSYERHKTLEVRVGKATMDSAIVIAWIRLLGLIADKNTKIDKKISTVNMFSKQFRISPTNKKVIAKMERSKAA